MRRFVRMAEVLVAPPCAHARSRAADPAAGGTGIGHRGGGFPQVVLSDHGYAPGQLEMITPRDRHGRLLATLQFGEGVGQTQLHAE